MKNHNREIYTIPGIFFLITAVIASLGNGYILYVVKRDPLKCFKKPTNVFNIALTMAHFFAGIVVLPYIGVLNILRGEHPEIFIPSTVLDLEEALLNFNIGTATLFLSAISGERCIAIIRPRLNKKWLTLNRAKAINFASGTICFAFCLLLLLPVSKTFFYFIYLPLFIFLPSCGILASCAVRLRNFKNQARVSVVNSGLPVAQLFALETRKRNSLLVYKLLNTVFSILLPILISLFMFSAVRIIEVTCEGCQNRKWFVTLHNVTLICLYLSSAFNPFVLHSRIAEYSRTTKHIFRK